MSVHVYAAYLRVVLMFVWGGMVLWVQNGRTPLSIASGYGCVKAMRLLLDSGAYVDSKDEVSTGEYTCVLIFMSFSDGDMVCMMAWFDVLWV